MSAETEEKKPETPQPGPAPVAEEAIPGKFIGGVIHIEADPKTGDMRISAPDNMVIALGIIETAKAILIENHAAKQRAPQRPEILRAGADTLHKLQRPS